MTDKATVEIPSPTAGKVTWLGGQVGDVIAIGSDFVRLDVDDKGASAAKAHAPATPAPAKPSEKPAGQKPAAAPPRAAAQPAAKAAIAAAPSITAKAAPQAGRPSGKPMAAPSVRQHARESGVDLRLVAGSGPAGRIVHDDIEAYLTRGPALSSAKTRKTAVHDIKVVGMRRRIAERMSLAKARIPHITYVEEVDMTALEAVRAALNAQAKPDRPKLTLLPFLMSALVKAIADHPQVNATFDDENGVVHQHDAVHIGMAVQTPAGLMVPVVRHAEAMDLWTCANELNRLADAARAGTASRDELMGSTITITSLGALGGVVSTPIINYPEVAIVGVNKMMVRPHWDGQAFVPRKMMNLSSGFDHRLIDGWDAARFVQRLKILLETPSLIFIEG